jgi:hypothetical protein
MDTFAMNTAAVDAAAKQVGQIAERVAASFAHAPAAAQSAAGTNPGYLTSQALVALCCTQLLAAVRQLSAETTEHSKLLQQSAAAAEQVDLKLAQEHFNTQHLSPNGR